MDNTRPAAEGIAPGHYPGPPVDTGHVAPCPRRLRARTGDGWVLDTTAGFYVWEHPYYPQYAVPAAGLPDAVSRRGRPVPDDPRLQGYLVLRFGAADAWYEEEERVYGHPRNPYVRVDAIRSHRAVTVRLREDGAEPRVLASAPDAVAVFETGLPPRWYLDQTTVDWSALTPSNTRTRCPYKGQTTDYWSAGSLQDVAWNYAAPATAVSPIAGLIAFDDSQLEVEVRLPD